MTLFSIEKSILAKKNWLIHGELPNLLIFPLSKVSLYTLLAVATSLANLQQKISILNNPTFYHS